MPTREPAIISDELLTRIIRNAFKSGVSWAGTYISWYSPNAEDVEIKMRLAVTNAKQTVRREQREGLESSPKAAE